MRARGKKNPSGQKNFQIGTHTKFKANGLSQVCHSNCTNLLFFLYFIFIFLKLIIVFYTKFLNHLISTVNNKQKITKQSVVQSRTQNEKQCEI